MQANAGGVVADVRDGNAWARDSAWPLLERDAELVALHGAVEAARDRAGAVAIIHGPPGAGKTSLLEAAVAYAGSLGVRVLSGRGRELERTVALGLVVDLLAAPVQGAPPAEQARLLAGRAAPAGQVLLEPDAEPRAPAETILLGLCWVAAHLAGWNSGTGKASPLLLAVDDVQWADVPSLRFLARLADQADRLPLSLVLALREGGAETAHEAVPASGADDAAAVLLGLSAHPRARLLAPAPLTVAAVGKMTETRFPGAGPDLTAAIAHASSGNPFFVAELLRSVPAAGGSSAARTPAAEAIASLVPAAVLRSVVARLARLPGSAARLAASLSVLGDGSPLRRAAAHAELTVAEAERAADLLAGARLLRPGSPLAFSHPLTGAAVHADLPGFARARAHRRAATLLAAEGENAEKVAGHLLAAEPEADAGSVNVLAAAARRALRRGDPAAAARLLRRALDEPPPPGQRAGLLVELAEAQATRGEVTADVPLTEALGLFGPAQVHARVGALAVLARIHHARGDLSLAAAASGQALDLLDPRDPAWEEALADFLSVATFHPPLVADAGRRLAPVLRDARQGRPPQRPKLLAHVTLRLALAGDRPQAVRALAERALAEDPLVDPADHGTLFGIVAHALVIVGEWAMAEAVADAALEAARRRGDFLADQSGCFHRALSRFRRGALTAALADLETVQASQEAGWRGAAGWIAALGAEINVDLGDLPAARRALRLADPHPADSMDSALLGHARARIALAGHDPAGALPIARAAGEHLARKFGIDHAGLLPWRATAALASHHVGDHERAVRLAAAALDRARATAITADIGAALRITGLVARPGPDTAVLAAAAETLARTPAALDHARALIDLGAALRRSGQRRESRQPLREGLALAERMHARPLAERARDELHAIGRRPRRAAVTGIDALTTAERRVVLLALNGYSNAAIAQTLFITTKTVETHLSRAYRKLGVSGRRDLRHAYGPQDPAGR